MPVRSEQANRALTITTPLGPNVLLLRGLSGQESVSELFRFQLELAAELGREVAFDRMLGQKVTAHLALEGEANRHFSGICSRFSEAGRDTSFTYYRMEIVPEFWLLTRRSQSRIFQHKSVPDILKAVLAGLSVDYRIEGTFHPRDFVVQYRETDFNFACRVMEEEGISYYFTHSEDGHKLVLCNTPGGHSEISGGSTVPFQAEQFGGRQTDQITSWEKTQELRPGKYTLWDHCFELPHKHLEAEKVITDSVQVGTITHKLKVSNNERLEVYDFPGEYAQRFDGIDSGGGEQASEIQKIFEDNKRTTDLRMQEGAAGSILIQGNGHCRRLVSGHRFTLNGHYDADGGYLLTSVQHSVRVGTDYRSGTGLETGYYNSFTCIPLGLPLRPQRITPRPVVQGTQTAVVVGPAGEEIFTDKYGRVKVQFHWDREGKNDANSSCWVRVSSFWAGKNWGAIHLPRVGQEVVVAFEEGDPDRPIIVGSVYNADMMPPYALPAEKTKSGIKSRSTATGTPENFNEIRFEDKKGSEQLFIHAEKDQDIEVENDETHWVGRDRKKTIDRHETSQIKGNRTETVDQDEKVTVQQGNRDVILQKGNDTHHLKMGNRDVILDMGNDTLTIKMGNQTTKLNLGKSETEALQSIELKVGQSSIKVDQMGVTIKGMMVKIEGQIQTEVKGLMTQVNGSAMLMCKGGITMIN